MTKVDLSLHHRVLEARNPVSEKPPMLLMLHGYGSHEEDLFSFAHMVNEKCTVVSVRAPLSLAWGGYCWYEIDFNNLGAKMNNTEQAKESLQKLRNFIDEAIEAYNIDGKQLWLMGFSQGAILSYGLSLSRPEKFSKILALSGYLLKEVVPEKFEAATLNHLDFFVSHGTSDDVIPVEWARQTVGALEKLKVSHKYREYPMGHGINPECMEDIKKWMREHQML